MKGWIFQRVNPAKSITYETEKLIFTAQQHNIQLSLHDPTELNLSVSRQNRKEIFLNNIPELIPDFLLPRMGATTGYFALAAIRHLENLKVCTINSSQSIETVKDKLHQMQILAAHNIDMPKTLLMKFPLDIYWVEKELQFPVVVKILSGSQGSGIFLCTDKNMLIDLAKMIELTSHREANIIMQEFIAGSKGRDLRVFVIGNKVIGAMERYSTDDSFKANFSRGGQVKAYKISSELEEKAVQITKLFGLEISGVDFLFDGDDFKICEINSSPGFKGLEKSTGINIAQEIISYVKSKI